MTEYDFIVELLYLQFLILMITVGPALEYPQYAKLRIVIPLELCTFAGLAFLITVGVIDGLSLMQLKIWESLLTHCEIERAWQVPVLVVARNLWERLAFRSNRIDLVVCMTTGMLIFSAGIQRCMKGTRLAAMLAKLKETIFTIRRYFRIQPWNPLPCLVFPICTVQMALLLFKALYNLENGRRELQKASGPLYQDSQWGFGQVTAVLAWVPVLLKVLREIVGAYPAISELWATHKTFRATKTIKGSGHFEHRAPGIASSRASNKLNGDRQNDRTR